MATGLENAVRERLTQAIDPHSGRPLAEALRAVAESDGNVALDIRVGYPAAGFQAGIEALVASALEDLDGVRRSTVQLTHRVAAHAVQGDLSPLPGVSNIIAIASGKGGVGKSTTAVNLALAIAAEGGRAGVLDADIYGPSVPRMMGLSGRPDSEDGKSIQPKENFGVQVMSIGFLIEEDTPMIWRGPMVTQALQQLLNETRWRDLDYLIIDLPPGTGDIQLTLAQRVPVSGAVIVTTPQDIALLDARKALRMFEKVNVPVLGIVENMAEHVCSECGHREPIFGSGGAAKMALEYGIDLLGELPLDMAIREQVDGGHPSVVADPDGAVAESYRAIARHACGRLSVRARDSKAAFPKIVVQDT